MTVYDFSLEQLAERLLEWGEPAFRARQVYAQLWRRAAGYEDMSDVSPRLRDRLVAELPLELVVLDEHTADRGATRKALLEWANTTIAAGDTAEEIDKLRLGGDGHILVWGGVSLWRSRMRLDLIDELQVSLFPTLRARAPGCSTTTRWMEA